METEREREMAEAIAEAEEDDNNLPQPTLRNVVEEHYVDTLNLARKGYTVRLADKMLYEAAGLPPIVEAESLRAATIEVTVETFGTNAHIQKVVERVQREMELHFGRNLKEVRHVDDPG